MNDEIYENRPKSIRQLRTTEYSLPRIEDCDHPSQELTKQVCEYTQVESPNFSTKSLNYLRSALIDGVSYHLWQLPTDDTLVLSEEFEGELTLSMGRRSDLTDEQFLVRFYLKSQWQIQLPVE